MPTNVAQITDEDVKAAKRGLRRACENTDTPERLAQLIHGNIYAMFGKNLRDCNAKVIFGQAEDSDSEHLIGIAYQVADCVVFLDCTGSTLPIPALIRSGMSGFMKLERQAGTTAFVVDGIGVRPTRITITQHNGPMVEVGVVKVANNEEVAEYYIGIFRHVEVRQWLRDILDVD